MFLWLCLICTVDAYLWMFGDTCLTYCKFATMFMVTKLFQWKQLKIKCFAMVWSMSGYTARNFSILTVFFIMYVLSVYTKDVTSSFLKCIYNSAGLKNRMYVGLFRLEWVRLCYNTTILFSTYQNYIPKHKRFITWQHKSKRGSFLITTYIRLVK